MTVSDEEDEFLANFLESEVLSEASDHEESKKTEVEEEEPKAKRHRVVVEDNEKTSTSSSSSSTSKSCTTAINGNKRSIPKRIDSGEFSKIPSELFHHIFKFLSSEDLVVCSLVCRFLNYVASDECLWHRLYCMRWGLSSPTKKLRECAWKKLYIQRDEEDMVEFVRNCPSEFKEYYYQMHASKRSQAPLLSQVNDDRIILDKTVADQVSTYKSSRGLSDKVVSNHACSGETCSYYQIEDVFVCEKTGLVHVCDDTCRDIVLDPTNGLLVCTISGHCFERLLSSAEMGTDMILHLHTYSWSSALRARKEQQQGGATDEAEVFMGSGRFAQAYSLGYNCADEKELEAALWFR